MVARALNAALLTLLLAAGVGCNRPDWDDPVNAYLSFVRAVQKSDAKTAWGALSNDSRKVLEERSRAISEASGGSVENQPAALFFALAQGAPPVKQVQLVKQEGNEAVVSVVPDKGSAREVRMVKEDGRWKLDVTQALQD